MATTPLPEVPTPLRQYMREISEAALLTIEEEMSLGTLIVKGREAEKALQKSAAPKKPSKKGGAAAKTISPADRKKLRAQIAEGRVARDKMISANLRLVVKIAQDYSTCGVPLLDIISEGNIGLTKAVERFDPTKGAKLSTYASWWIKQSIRRAISDQAKTIRLPIHLTDKIARMRRLESQLSEEFGRAPSDDELADELQMPVHKVSRLRMASLNTASLNAKVGASDDGAELGELVGDDRVHAPDHLVQQQEITRTMMQLLSTLDERERTILVMRYGLNGAPAMTLEEVGDKFKITRERIRQLQNLGLEKLEKALTADLSKLAEITA